MAGAPVWEPTFEEETDRLTGTRVREGNDITLLATGPESYDRRWQMIEDAKAVVHICSFSFMRDDTTRRLAELAVAKVREGVEVKIIVDDAALYTTFSRGILRRMADGGVEVLTYDSPWRYFTLAGAAGHPLRKGFRNLQLALKRRFHEKYLVVDGREAILGGMNWGTKYALGGTDVKWWRDSDVHLTGPVVADVQRRFLADVFVYRAQREAWRRRRDKSVNAAAFVDDARAEASAFGHAHATTYFPSLPVTGHARVRYVGHKPWDEQAVPLTNAVLQLIRSARSSIYWGCHGVRPPRVVAENLADAVGRGVEVHLITNSKESSRSLMGHGLMGWMWWECRHYFRWLVEHGVHLHLWQLPGAFHSKNLVVDGVVAAVGSYNVASGSTFHHSESAVISIGGDFPGAVRAQFDRDLENCRTITMSDTRGPLLPLALVDPWRRPLHERNLLIDRSLWPEEVAADLDAGRLKWKYADKPTGPEFGALSRRAGGRGRR